ncbi:hypothetical protein ABPG72_006343 [Tetrahymena utriculariae]
MVDYFVFPYTYEDILKSADERYCVNVEEQRRIKNMEDKRMNRTLKELESAFVEDYTEIKQHERFDILYFLIDNFGSKNSESPNLIKFSLSTIEQAGELLLTYLNSHLRRVKEDCQNQSIAPEVLADDRHSLKMIIFLTTFFLRNTCIRRISTMKEDNNDETHQNKKGKKNAGGEENYDNLIEKQRICIDLLQKTLQLDLKTLYQKKSIDEEFYKYYLATALRLLESKPFIRAEKARTNIFAIIRTVMRVFSEYNKQELKQVQLNFINLIYEDENLVQPIADFIIDLYNDKNLIFSKEFTFDLLQILVTFLQEKTNPSSENTVFKNARDFFSILSNHLPKIFINNLSCFLTLFDSESYLMRNTVCEILGNILKNVLTAQNEEDEEFILNEESKIKQKEKLLDRLIDRVYDKHAYSRAQVLTILADLCENNAIPPQFLPQILKAAISRTRDVGAIVRRKALQLISRVVNYYVYIYQTNKDGKFITKEQVIKEIKKLDMQNLSCAEQLEKIEERLREITQSEDPAELLLLQDEIESLTTKQKSVKAQMAQIAQLQSRYQEYQDFLHALDILIPILIQLLGSKSVYDVLETIRLLMYLKKYNITTSELGIKKMIVLIWSKEKAVKEEVMQTYWSIYMNNKEQKPQRIAKNLINLMIDTNITEASSFEELLLSMMDTHKISQEELKSQNLKAYPIQDQVFAEVWEIFTKNFRRLCEADPNRERTEQESLEYEKELILQKKEMRSAIQILRIISSRQKSGWSMKLESFKNILNYYKKFVNKVDWVIVKEIACISEQVKSEDNKAIIESIAQILTVLLIRGHGTEDSEWFLSCEQIIRLTFLTFTNPETIIKYLIKKMSQFLFEKKIANDGGAVDEEEDEPNQNKDDLEMQLEKDNKKDDGVQKPLTSKAYEHKLAQVLYIAGNSALKFLMHCDKIEEYLNKRRIEAENNKQKEMQNDVNENEDKDIDKINGGFEAEFEEHQKTLHSIQDKLIIESPIYSYFCSIATKICWNMFNSLSLAQRSEADNINNKLRRNVILDRVAMLCLIKFMCVSSQVCKKNLDLIFNMLESQADAIVKTNILIGIGDLYHRYPIILERYLHFVYKSLSDKDVRVRKTCLMVITHLVLNDMLKVKAEISSIAVLIEDSDQRIQNMVKLFFHELNKKDPKAIYNLLPELIGRLSTENINESIFNNFCENVLPHIDKDKQAESLVDKLCQRFTLVNTEKEWINISHALKMFSYNEKSLKKLLEHFESKYREKLNIPTILENFKAIILKTKKMPRQSQEQKQLIDELESKISNFKKETFDDKKYKKEKPKPKQVAGTKGNQANKGAAGNAQKKGKQNVQVPNLQAQKKGQQQQMEIESDEEDEAVFQPNRRAKQQQQQLRGGPSKILKTNLEEVKNVKSALLAANRTNIQNNTQQRADPEEIDIEDDDYDEEEEEFLGNNRGQSSRAQQIANMNQRASLRNVQRKSLKEDSDDDDFDEEF